MAAHVKTLENTKKHWTKQEREARERAESSLLPEQKRLVAPVWVKEDDDAYRYWTSTLRRLRETELLTPADADVLGTYCHIAARLEKNRREWANGDVMLADAVAADEKTLLNYAGKLGLTPDSRARLAKKRAEKAADPDADLYGDEM